VLGRALPAKNSVKYSMTLCDGVSANRLNIIDDGQVLIEPRYCSAACSTNMAATLAVIISDCVYLQELGIYTLEYVVAAAVECGMCGRYWTTRTCALAVAAVVMSPADRELLKVQVASVQQNKGRCRAAE